MGSNNTSTTDGGVRPRPNRMVERFRVKNDLLVSEIDEMDWVEHDEVPFALFLSCIFNILLAESGAVFITPTCSIRPKEILALFPKFKI